MMAGEGKSQLRSSDSSERHFICIEAWHKIRGVSIQTAAAHVATELGKRTDREVEVIRNGYYEFRRRCRLLRGLLELWISSFFSWRDWVLSSDESTIQFALTKYREKYGRARMIPMAKLMNTIRRDPAQAVHNLAWREGPENRPGDSARLELHVHPQLRRTRTQFELDSSGFTGSNDDSENA